MRAKEFLSQLRRSALKVKIMGEQLRLMRETSSSISPVLSNMPRSSTPNIRRNEDAIVRIMDLESALYDELGKLADIHRTIFSVKDTLRYAVLVDRYIKGESWEVIAHDLDLSLRRVHQIHKAALAEIEAYMPALH